MRTSKEIYDQIIELCKETDLKWAASPTESVAEREWVDIHYHLSVAASYIKHSRAVKRDGSWRKK